MKIEDNVASALHSFIISISTKKRMTLLYFFFLPNPPGDPDNKIIRTFSHSVNAT